MFEEYLISFHRKELLEIMTSEDKSRHFTININFIELHEHNIELTRVLLNDPEISLEEWDKAAVSAQLTLLKQLDKTYNLKINVHCRIHYLAHLARRGSVFPGNKDVGKFLQISGTVMRISAAKLLEYQRNYVCTKCKTLTIVKANYDRKYMIKQPKQCQNSECSGTNLVSFGELDSDNCKDYQEIKLQEQVKKLGVGSIPNTIWVTLEDDLVDSCQPGDDVTICGTVRRQFGEFSPGKKIEISLVFKANHVQVDTNSSSFSITTPEIKNMFGSFWEKYAQNPLEGRDIILKSFCSQIYGLYPVKLATAVVLAGGCPTEDTTLTGIRTRSESHLLLVGDPGTGKSQLLKFASKIIPRAVLTTGIGSTAAGLTVTATMEHGEWQLEAGALVLADGGICCIDELNTIKEHDRTTIHEAMEQQTISVAKASMVCKMNTRCSVLAACNPKGNLDPGESLSMNVALPSPLLSRFDLIMLIRDTVNREWDESVMDYILNNGSSISKLTDFGLWSIGILQSYFKLIKKFQPKLTEDAELILSTYYNLQRRMESRNKARTTVRLLESLVRLSQGHARLMYHEKVLVIDSIYAVYLIEVAMNLECSLLNLNVCSNSVFPEKPKSDYRQLAETILNKLQLLDILDKELSNLDTESVLQSRYFANPKEKNQKAASNEVVEKNVEEHCANKKISTSTDDQYRDNLNEIRHKPNTCINNLEQNDNDSGEKEIQNECHIKTACQTGSSNIFQSEIAPNISGKNYEDTKIDGIKNMINKELPSENIEKDTISIASKDKHSLISSDRHRDSFNEKSNNSPKIDDSGGKGIDKHTLTKCQSNSSNIFQTLNGPNILEEPFSDDVFLPKKYPNDGFQNEKNCKSQTDLSITTFQTESSYGQKDSEVHNKITNSSLNKFNTNTALSFTDTEDDLNIDFDMNWNNVRSFENKKATENDSGNKNTGTFDLKKNNLNIFSSCDDFDFDI